MVWHFFYDHQEIISISFQNPKIPVLSFCVIPQSPSLLKIAFQGTYCLEVRLRGGGLVSIRDGAYSRFDRVSVVLEFTPTQGLKGFLSKYVDENAVYRRRSQSEDDNPPSPIQMDDVPQLFRGPQSPRDSGLRFAGESSNSFELALFQTSLRQLQPHHRAQYRIHIHLQVHTRSVNSSNSNMARNIQTSI